MDNGLLKPGDVLNNTYQIDEKVGDGGTGEVYRATNTASQRPVAIKILKAQFSQDPKFIDLMRRELLHNISHDAVVRYYDLLRTGDEEGGHYFLVMDFIDGPSLADLMGAGPVDTGFLMTLAERVTQGLAACHAAKIYHRDISPDNIILRGGDPAKATLIDFGIAKDVNPDAKTVVGGGFAGKYEYAAPEQLDGLADARSDLYSFGMTLLAAARGESPKLGTSFLEIVKAKHSPVDVSGVDQPLAGLIEAMVKPSPDDRPQSAIHLLALIGGAGSDAPRTVIAPAGGLGAAPEGLTPSPPGGIESLLEPEEGEAPAAGRYSDQKRRAADRDAAPKKKGKGGLIAALLLLIAAGLGGFYALGPGKELIGGLTKPPLPTMSPYEMTIASANGATTVTGHAPSEDARDALSSALASRLGIAADNVEIAAAQGAPNEAWQSTVTALADLLKKLEDGALTMRDTEIELKGTASDPEIESDVSGAANTIARNGGYQLALNLTLAPQPLEKSAVDGIVAEYADCGPLAAQPGADAARYAPGEAIAVTGSISTQDSLDALQDKLGGIADDRAVNTDGVRVINQSVCRVRDLLPPTDEHDIDLVYYSDITDLRLDDDYFNPEDFAVIELRAPKDMDGYLYVFIVDNEYNAFHLRPARTRPENELGKIGTVQGEERVIPLTWPQVEGSREKPAIGFSEPYGDALVFALVSDAKLFPFVRADVEDTREFAPELAQAIATRRAEGGQIDQAQRFILVDTQ